MRHLALALCLLGCQAPKQECPPAPAPVTTSPAAPAAPTPADAPKPTGAETAAASPSKTTPVKPPLHTGNQVDTPSSLEEINRWATAAGVRDDLLRWVAEGLPTQNLQTEVALEYVGAEAPVTAVATVTLDRYLDDSVRGERFILKFSRKACETCPSGMSGWWLWEMDVTRRCYKGRGHETFSKDRCL